jgi:hypothetical protein
MTAVELEVFTKLSGNKGVNVKGPQGVLGMEQRPTEVFATALVSLGLPKLTKSDSSSSSSSSSNTDANNDARLYSNSELADTFLDINKPSGYMGDFIIMMYRQFLRQMGQTH